MLDDFYAWRRFQNPNLAENVNDDFNEDVKKFLESDGDLEEVQ